VEQGVEFVLLGSQRPNWISQNYYWV